MGFLAAAASYIGSFFTTAGAATAGTAVAADSTVAGVVAGGATAGTVAGTTAATAALAGTATTATIATTVSEAAAIASGASSLAQLASGPGRINIPPTPGVIQQDQAVANTEQAALARREAAGGLQSTLGTSGGQQGAMLNPTTLSQRSLLGG